MEPFDDPEANFISKLHDMQMAEDNPVQVLFLRMQKEMSPALMRILQEARSNRDRDPSAAIVALAQYCACVIMASCSGISGGKRPEDFKHEYNRRALIITTFASLQDFLQDYLKKDGLAPFTLEEIQQMIAEAHEEPNAESRTP